MTAGPERNVAIGLMLDLYGALLTERQREVMDLYFNDDLSLSEVAEECGITRQGVRDALIKGEEQLWDFEAHLKLLEKKKKTEENLRFVLEGLSTLSQKGLDTEALKEKIRELL